MTVRVNKSAFNLIEKLSELTQSIGLKGRQLMRAVTTQDARNLVSAGRKNMVINGDMRIFQRNNSGNVPNASTYYLDRWKLRNSSSGTLYITQQNGTSGPPGFRSWMLVECDGADTSPGISAYTRIQQYIEGYNCFMDWGYGNTDYITVSFWVKSTTTGVYTFGVEDGDASPIYLQDYTIDQPNVWEKKVLHVPPPKEGTWKGADNGVGARLTWTLMAGSQQVQTGNTWVTSYGMSTGNQVNFLADTNNNFYITGVQVEVGRNATDFEYRSYGEELALCQRYYTKIIPGAENIDLGLGWAITSSSAIASIPFPTSMRISPSALEAPTSGLDFFIGYQNTTINVTGLSFSAASPEMARLTGTLATSATVGQGIALRTRDANAYTAFSAEL